MNIFKHFITNTILEINIRLKLCLRVDYTEPNTLNYVQE